MAAFPPPTPFTAVRDRFLMTTAATDRASILLVDDRAEDLLTLEAVLEGTGCELVKAQSGPEALKRVLERDFAAVLLDVHMPEMDGFETARFIRQRDRSKETPIVFITGVHKDEDDRLNGYAAGGMDYLSKPFDPAALRAKILSLVKLWQEARESERLREAQHAAILAAALDAVITMDAAGRIGEWNPAAAKMFGYSREAALGRDLAQLIIPPRLREGHTQGLRHYLRTGEGVVLGRRLELSALRADGSEIPVELTVTRLPGSDPPLFTGFLRDISDRVQAEQALAEREAELQRQLDRNHAITADLETANRRKDEFLALLAHELRNPLAPALSALYLLRERAPDDPDYLRASEIAVRQLRHMAQLVDDLLDVSRITRGKIELRRQRLDLAAAAQHSAEAMRPVIAARRHELLLRLPDRPVWVDADATRLDQVLTNLLSNAAKYTDPGGRIELSVEVESCELRVESSDSAGPEVGLSTLNSQLSTALNPQPSTAYVRLRDTGAGIPAEMLPRIFDLFAQLDRTLDRAQGGLGIGLTLVKRLVELHGGRVAATSDGPGRGSEFLVSLPLAASEPAGQSANPPGENPVPPLPLSLSPSLPGSRAPLPPLSPADSRRILLVDDNVDGAETLAEILQLRGHVVWLAHDGHAALREAAERVPEVVLLDIGLPGLDGYAVARRLRETAANSPLLVALTGYGQADDLRRAREAGFDHHLVKPVDPERLLSLLAGQAAGQARQV